MRRLSLFLVLLACLQFPSISHAFSAIAYAKDHPVDTIYAAWNYPSQKEADLNALQGCRIEAKKNSASKHAVACKVMHRQMEPGGGAIVCGKTGCSMHTGSDTKQDAVDSAYQFCEQQNYGNCRKTNITAWWDDAGYSNRAIKNPATVKTCGPPPGKVVRSTTQCNNGDCSRTFENGCTVRFQATYCHDPFSGKWEWKPDGC